MNLALKEAWKYQIKTYPNPAVGALILDKNGKILSISAHKMSGEPHAELNAVKEAYLSLTEDSRIEKIKNSNQLHKYLLENHNNIFKEASIYVTLEPCNHYGKTPPCSLLISNLKFKNIFIGLADPNPSASGGINFLKDKNINIKIGICEEKAKELITPFIKWQKSNFIFFKLATTLNGVITGGIISSKESRRDVHKIRDKIDLLVIGGNTVRVDRPTLDSRMVKGEAPDILIYSKKKKFDKNIPLFSIPNRKVYIEDNFEKLKLYKNIMIEGGEGMLNATKEIVDWYLIYQTPIFKESKNIPSSLSLKELHSYQNRGFDRVYWYKSNR